MKPLRFCMITTFYPPYHFGGDALFVRGLARALVAAGHEVEVVHCEDAFRLRGGPVAEPDDDDGVRVHRLRSRLGPLSPLYTQQTGMPGPKRPALERILARPFDVMHFHNVSLVGGPGVLAMGRAPIKLYTPHEFWLFCPTHVLWKDRCRPCDRRSCLPCCLRSHTPPQLWRYTGLVERSLAHIDCLLALSRFCAERHRQAGINRPIELLPVFTEIAPPTVVSPPAARPRFLYVGRLTPSKGVLDLARAFASLPELDLDIAGGGELLPELVRMARSRPNLRVLGALPWEQLPPLYAAATATVVPSLGAEISGLVVLESMACGTPVVVREAGGSAEAVAASGGGVVYHSMAELGPILQRLASDRSWRDQLAAAARRGYLERCTARVHLERYLEIIRRIREAKARTS